MTTFLLLFLVVWIVLSRITNHFLLISVNKHLDFIVKTRGKDVRDIVVWYYSNFPVSRFLSVFVTWPLILICIIGMSEKELSLMYIEVSEAAYKYWSNFPLSGPPPSLS